MKKKCDPISPQKCIVKACHCPVYAVGVLVSVDLEITWFKLIKKRDLKQISVRWTQEYSMVRHFTPAILQMIVRLSREGRTQLEIAVITGVSLGAISKILKQSSDTGTPNQWLCGLILIYSLDQIQCPLMNRGYFSLKNSRKTLYSSPVSWCVVREWKIWLLFYQCNCCTVCTIV